MRDRKKAQALAHELVSKMTIEERASQLKFDAPPVERLGVPAYNWWNEALHGVARAGTATMFPQPVAMASMFDPEMIRKIGDVVATEARAKYNEASKHGDRDIYKGLTFWSPNINLFRDPRWGRGQETYSEDPCLTAQLGVAYIKGLQGDGKYLKVAACAKHYAVHSGPEAIRHEFDAEVSQKDLWETYLPAFEAAVKEGEVEAVMGAYNRTLGEPCCGSDLLIRKILRGKWGFQGHFVSDCWAISDFHLHHHITTTAPESAALAIKMGCDVNCGNTYLHLLRALEDGLITEDDITTAAERLFTTRFMLGEFDENCEYNSIPYEVVECPEHLALSEEAARRSVVLLKNDGGLLPLDIDKTKKVVLIGPNCAQRFCVLGLGGSSGAQAVYETTPLKGLEAKLAGKADLAYLPLTGDSEFQPIPNECWVGKDGRNGVTAVYRKQGSGDVQQERIEPVVDFTWFNASPVPGKIEPGYVHATVEGKLKAPVTGNYTLRLITDDHAELWVSDMGAQAVRNAEAGVPQRNTAMFFFEAGKTYDVRIDYSQSPDGRKNATEMNYWAKDNPSLRLEWAMPSDADIIAGQIAPYREQLADADAIVFVGGTDHNLDCEGRDRTSMQFPQGQTELIRQVSAINGKTIVVLMHGAPIDLPWIDRVPAVLDMFFPGMEGGTAMADILFGDADPSGRLTFSWPERLEDSPVYKLATQDVDNVNYEDSLMVGYRYFDTKRVTPRYEFGYGLSYTTFDYSKMKVKKDGDNCIVTLNVKNTGSRDGAEVVQIYVGQKNCRYTRPVHELKAFDKVFLKPGESREVTFTLDKDAFSYWNPDRRAWVRDSDEFTIEAGHSSRDIRRSAKVRF